MTQPTPRCRVLVEEGKPCDVALITDGESWYHIPDEQNMTPSHAAKLDLERRVNKADRRKGKATTQSGKESK